MKAGLGLVGAEGDLGSGQVVVGPQVPVERVETVYSRFSDVLPIACCLLVLAALGVSLRRPGSLVRTG